MKTNALKVKYWYIVTWVNNNIKRGKGYLHPKLYGIFGGDVKEDTEVYCFDEKNRAFVINYKTKLILVNKGQITHESTLKDELDRVHKEYLARVGKQTSVVGGDND